MAREVFDLAIVGIGPAGYTAGIYAARKQLKTVVVGDKPGGQTSETWEVANYPGFAVLTGPELVERFEKHLRQFDLQLIEHVVVTKLEKKDDLFYLKTRNASGKESEIWAESVIVASGKKERRLDVPGEKEFRNKGVTYCATCDAPFFAGKIVAMVGGGNSALEGALQLSKIAKKTYLLNIEEELGGDPILQEKVVNNENIEVINRAETQEIFGDKLVSGLKYKDLGTGEEREIELSGVFIEIGSVPSVDFVKDVVELNQKGEIKIDKKNETNIEGLFAAGDVTDVLDKQIVVAAGEGAKAALSANEYLAKRKEK